VQNAGVVLKNGVKEKAWRWKKRLFSC